MNMPIIKPRKFRANQKIRVICGSAHFYTTVKEIKTRTVGDSIKFNDVLSASLLQLELKPGTSGICWTVNGVTLQIDVVE